MRALLLAGLTVALVACGPASTKAAPEAGAQIIDQGDNIVDFAGDDAQMNGAKLKARQTLPIFWRHLEAHPEMEHDLKVGLPTAAGSLEHIWVSDIKIDGAKIAGRLVNDPVDLAGLSMGSPVTFTRDQISDWAYVKDGKMYGHYTTRVVVKHLDPTEAAQLKAMLSQNPVESDAS